MFHIQNNELQLKNIFAMFLELKAGTEFMVNNRYSIPG